MRREQEGGLGLSVKGGREHGLPPLISRIIPKQAAAKTQQLFVGDAIMKVEVEDFAIITFVEALFTHHLINMKDISGPKQNLI